MRVKEERKEANRDESACQWYREAIVVDDRRATICHAQGILWRERTLDWIDALMPAVAS